MGQCCIQPGYDYTHPVDSVVRASDVQFLLVFYQQYLLVHVLCLYVRGMHV